MSVKFNRCTIQIRKLPLETFRLPRDGRKWKQLARSRYGLLLEISTFANGDGSFLSPDTKINFSPSSEKLLRHRTKDTLYRLANDLRELGLLSWHRNNHYGRRFYELHLSGKQGRHWSENRSDIRDLNRSDIRNNRSDQQDVITGPTSSTCPSLEALPSGGSPGSPPLGGPVHLSQDQGESGGYAAESSSSGKATAKKNDDDSAAVAATLSPDAPDRIERLLEQAKAVLVGRGHERDYVEVALDFIEKRAVEWGKTPATVQYYLASFETHLSSREESYVVRNLVEKRRARYAKFGMPLDPTTLRLTPEQEEARQSFNERHKGTTVQPNSENEFPDVQPEPSESPTKREPTNNTPPVSFGNSALTQYEAEKLLFDADYYRHDARHDGSYEAFERRQKLVHRKFVRFANHTGEFRSEEKRREFVDHIHRLSNKKQANDAKRAGRNQRRRELRKQRHPTRSNRPRKKARK